MNFKNDLHNDQYNSLNILKRGGGGVGMVPPKCRPFPNLRKSPVSAASLYYYVSRIFIFVFIYFKWINQEWSE